MKVHRVEMIIIDHDGLGADGVRVELENTRYANRCISPKVRSIETKDIGEWTDAHPLNRESTHEAFLKKLFDK